MPGSEGPTDPWPTDLCQFFPWMPECQPPGAPPGPPNGGVWSGPGEGVPCPPGTMRDLYGNCVNYRPPIPGVNNNPDINPPGGSGGNPSIPKGPPQGSGGSQAPKQGARTNNLGPKQSLKALLNQLLGMVQSGEGFPGYEGDLTAGLTPDQMGIYNSFFGAGGGFETGQNALSSIAQQDSLGRAQLMLQPALDRTIQQTRTGVRERQNLGNNLLSTGGQQQEERAVGDVQANFMDTLARMIPQLDATRIGAAQGLTQNTAAGMGIGDILRGAQQDELTAKYNEFLRTTPMGGPLQALIGLLGGNRTAGQNGGGGGNDGPSLGQNILGLIAALAGSGAGSSIINNIASNPNWYVGDQRGPG